MTATPFELYPDRLVVDVWSDVICPWCYIGDTLLSRAIASFDQPVQTRYHSYQLSPDAPDDLAGDLTETMVKSMGVSVAQAEEMHRNVTERAAQIGLTYNLDTAIAASTRKAHRLTHFAKDGGRQHEMVMRLFQAYFTESLHIGDNQVLANLAADVGLDRDEALAVVESDTYLDEVDSDVALARQLGITGVPFFVFDGKYAVSGAQPVEVLSQALSTAWADRTATTP